MPGLTHEHIDSFQALVQSLSEKLGPCSGINSDDVDEKELQQLMEDYVSDEAEWKRYSLSAPNTAYTRNLVDKGNGKSNLLLLVWSPGKSSPIHDSTPAAPLPAVRGHLYSWVTKRHYLVADQNDRCVCSAGDSRHANAHCIMKILKGSLVETRYAWPTVDLNNSADRPLQTISSKTYGVDQVTYMSDKLGLHRISNPNKDEFAVSLHLYTPPNAAVYGCNVFNEANGHSTHIKKCTVYSEYGSALCQEAS